MLARLKMIVRRYLAAALDAGAGRAHQMESSGKVGRQKRKKQGDEKSGT